MSILEGIKNWYIVFFAIGIGCFLLYPNFFNSHFQFIVLILFFNTVLLAFFYKNHLVFICFLMLGFSFTAGMLRAFIRHKQVEHVILTSQQKFCHVRGWIEKQDARQKRKKLIIRVKQACRLKNPPYRIRISSSMAVNAQAGDGVKFNAVLRAPPEQIAPETYNIKRTAYYKKIGAYGFAVSNLDPVSVKSNHIIESFERKIIRLRRQIEQKINLNLNQPIKGLISALLVGNKTGVDLQTRKDFQIAGLAHLLAISGLHMGLIAGGCFFFLRGFFALFVYFSNRYDVRKPAGFLAILVTIFYLLISGASVSTQRAAIMAITAFLAILFDRQVFSLRSVMIAFFIILLLRPESLFEAGFQMSFAAVIALIAFYEYRKRKHQMDYIQFEAYPYFIKYPLKILRYGYFLMLTSLIAGGATSFIAAFHFHKIVSYGLISNLLVLPIFTFITMPCGIFVFIFLPFGIEAIPLMIMELSLENILWIIQKITHLPYASIDIKMIPFSVFILYIFGFLCLCIGPVYRIRITGTLFMLTGFLLWIGSKPPDFWMGQKGAMAVKDSHAKQIYLVQVSSRNFGVRVFSGLSQSNSYRKHKLIKAKNCNESYCMLSIQQHSILYVRNPIEKICNRAYLIIASHQEQINSSDLKACRSKIILQSELQKKGNCLVWLNGRYVFNQTKPVYIKCSGSYLKAKS